MSGLQTVTTENLRTAPASAPNVLPHVLVADADDKSRLRRSRQLETRGFRVSVARTTFEAIVKASCHIPDLILVDESLGSADVADTVVLLATCPATSHIPLIRLSPGRRLPSRLLSRARA